MADQKVIAVVGATGMQGGGLARALARDGHGPFKGRGLTRSIASDKAKAPHRTRCGCRDSGPG